MSALLHPFERSHLGLAPFRCVGHERRVIVHGIGPTAVVQPAGTCDHCGTGIADCYVILSSDGKRFVVGSSCVEKTYKEVNTAVPVDIRRQIAAVARVKSEARRQAKWDAIKPRQEAAQMILDARPALFTDRPHTNAFFANQGKTFRDYVIFNLTRGGLDGITWACKTIEAGAVHLTQPVK